MKKAVHKPLFIIFSVLLIFSIIFSPQASGKKKGGMVDGLRGIRIDGICYQEHGKSAVIVNEKLCYKGDKIGGFKIEEIRERDVVLSDSDGELYYLSVGGIKRAPPPKPSGIIDKIKQLKDDFGKAKEEQKKVEERDKKALEIIQEKQAALATPDGRFAPYGEPAPEAKPEDKPEAKPEDKERQGKEQVEEKDGTLIGHVYVWGDEPGSVGSSEGILVSLVREGDPNEYRVTVDQENRFSITAPPGEYKLIIHHPGYKPYEKEVTVKSGCTRLVGPIGLENDL